MATVAGWVTVRVSWGSCDYWRVSAARWHIYPGRGDKCSSIQVTSSTLEPDNCESVIIIVLNWRWEQLQDDRFWCKCCQTHYLHWIYLSIGLVIFPSYHLQNKWNTVDNCNLSVPGVVSFAVLAGTVHHHTELLVVDLSIPGYLLSISPVISMYISAVTRQCLPPPPGWSTRPPSSARRGSSSRSSAQTSRCSRYRPGNI